MLMPTRLTTKKRRPPRLIWFWLLCTAGFAVAGLVFFQRGIGPLKRDPHQTSPEAPDSAIFASYGKTPSCISCHQDAYQLWQGSHHALAERPINVALDSTAFEPPFKIRHGSQTSQARLTNGQFQVVTRGFGGDSQVFQAQRVIGVDPLRQVLIPERGGRLQVGELAFDSRHPGWFDIYGEDDRQPGEWGHWTGRGMTWNTMCAACHNTRLRKHYQESTDSYATSMAEMGVGCEACHGPMGDHNAWQAKHPTQKGDPTIRRLDRDQMLSLCASCHSRRAELTGDFIPGQSFYDHFALTIPDDTDLFYPDGQVRDEDYEFTAFLGSRMRAAGVRCVDCHEPHSSKTRLPGNSLCLSCHATPVPPALKIDPATHSHHPAGDRGDNCVDCHMPQTVYMQRHPRHDHGFTIPDPLLTKQLGIPNACTRCHSDQTTEWLITAVDKWYGARMERPARARAQVIAHARTGGTNYAPDLLRLLRGETNSLWRVVSANLLRHWASDPSVTAALLARASDPDPLVRSMSVRALEPLAQSGGQPVQLALRSRLDDPVRSVRVDAAWALHSSLDTNSTAGQDLLNYFRHSGDQPSGALQHGVFLMDRGDLVGAMVYFRRAVNWDTNSAPSHNALAVALSMEGKSDEAVQELQIACRLAPRDADLRFKLGLALSEVGKADAARAALEEAVKLEPQFAQAWYNLGLAWNAAGNTESALESLSRAETIDTTSAQIPYARATILARLGRAEEARAAARRALQIQPSYSDAAGLLQTLAK
jgi:predicted CXXCH cytochrome family protein